MEDEEQREQEEGWCRHSLDEAQLRGGNLMPTSRHHHKASEPHAALATAPRDRHTAEHHSDVRLHRAQRRQTPACVERVAALWCFHRRRAGNCRPTRLRGRCCATSIWVRTQTLHVARQLVPSGGGCPAVPFLRRGHRDAGWRDRMDRLWKAACSCTRFIPRSSTSGSPDLPDHAREVWHRNSLHHQSEAVRTQTRVLVRCACACACA